MSAHLVTPTRPRGPRRTPWPARRDAYRAGYDAGRHATQRRRGCLILLAWLPVAAALAVYAAGLTMEVIRRGQTPG